MKVATTTHLQIIVATTVIVGILTLRLFLLDFIPLYDKTEARYAEIARIMFETNQWITPQIDYQQAFWGKPPMHTWMSALSFQIFGVSAFTARLPHYLSGILILLLTYRFVKNTLSNDVAITAILVLSTSLGFVVAMGMVMTDIALVLSTTIAMFSFWKAYTLQKPVFHGHLFFASLALGMLIKGPVSIAIVAIALVTWSIWQRNLYSAISSLPWFTGLVLFSILSVPWYLLAEFRTPGFFEYFIVGEHFQRFFVSGWEGDLYGSAHDKIRGTIWLYWLLAAFPWSFIVIAKWISFIASPVKTQTYDALTPYLICWMIAPMILFSMAGNVLPAYVLPGFVAMAVLLGKHITLSKLWLLISSITCLLLVTVPLAKYGQVFDKTSEVELLGSNTYIYNSYPLYYWKKRPYSARFYSRGLAQKIDDISQLDLLISNKNGFFIATENAQKNALISQLIYKCEERKITKARTLLFCDEVK